MGGYFVRWRYLRLDLHYLIGELIIVVLGVLIALAANGLYEQRQERQREAAYLDRLRSDLQTGSARLQDRQRRYNQSLTAAAKLVDELESSSPTDSDLLAYFLYAVQIGGNSAGYAHDTTYRELLSTGNLNIVSDDSLRGRIVDYYRRADNFTTLDTEALPYRLLELFLSLVGQAPERYTLDDRNYENDRAFSSQEQERILDELLGNRREYVRVLRHQIV